MPLTAQRFDELDAIRRAGDPTDPIFRQIEAETTRVLTPILDHELMTGQLPRVLTLERPATDVAEAIHIVAALWLARELNRPVLLDYPAPAPARPTVKHAWRVAKRCIL